jgi:F-type H+-transporting ATPase subunit 8
MILSHWNSFNKNKMPQLVPFYFINQVTFAFILLVIMIYVFSKYILPRFVRLFISRIFISKL